MTPGTDEGIRRPRPGSTGNVAPESSVTMWGGHPSTRQARHGEGETDPPIQTLAAESEAVASILRDWPL